jgi:lipopolysaccharide/colanic/teichoic acid biosynthesis glycosyltransferase
MDIEQTTEQKTSNRPAIQDASAFPRKLAETYRVDLRPRDSVAAAAVMIAADAFILTLAWAFCILLFRLAGHPSQLGVVVGCLATLPVTLVVFSGNDLYPAFGMKRSEEVRRVLCSITGVQAACVGAFWLFHAAGGVAPALALGSLSMVLVPIGRLLTREAVSKKLWWNQSVVLIRVGAEPKDLAEVYARFSQVYATGVVGETEHALLMAPGGAEFAAPKAAETFGRFINRPLFATWKRIMDVFIALTAGIILLPLIVTIVAAVKLTSRGSIFYGHLRVGKNNNPIRVWKFRTMVQDADVVLAERFATDQSLRMEWERNHKLRADPRLTPIGNFLRRSSLDELPQLWNVITGDMSIVGPRPIIEAEIPKYAEYFADYTKVLPGITGLWQVSGRNETTYQQRVYLDSYYVNNWSPLLDLYVLFRTVKAVVSARGAY